MGRVKLKKYRMVIKHIILASLLITACSLNADLEGTQSVKETTISEDTVTNDDISGEYDVTDSENLIIKDMTFSEEFSAVLGYIPEEYQEDTVYPSWIDEYGAIAYCRGDKIEDNTYRLAYIDQDDIPELIVEDGWIKDFYTWNGESRYYLGTNFQILGYDEKKGKILAYYNKRINYSDENLDIYVFSYKKGIMRSDIVVTGTWSGYYGKEYQIGNASFDQEAFDTLSEYFDFENFIYWGDVPRYSQVEIINVMNTGYDSSYTHRYEVIYDDVTWEEAQEICEEKGGYLATITSLDEFNRIKELFMNRDELAVCYIGCRDTQSGDGLRWILKDKNTISAGGGGIYIYKEDRDCPYLFEKLVGSVKEDREYGFLFFYKLYGKPDEYDYFFYLTTGPSDLAGEYPGVSGKVGFICEYDE